MQQHEFEVLTGKSVSTEAYAKIERIYRGAPNIDKDQFCREYKVFRLGESETVEDTAEANEKMTLRIRNLSHDLEQEREIKVQLTLELEALRNANTTLIKERNEAIAQKVEMATVLLKSGMENEAAEILGRGYVISLKCSLEMEFGEEDRKYIAQVFGNKI